MIVPVGGADGAGIVAFDAAGGEVVWQATGERASYSSPILAEIGGKQRALVWTATSLFDLDPSTGEVGASFEWRSRMLSSANAATPLVVDEQVFLSAVYGTGAVLLKTGDNGFQEVWSSNESLSTHYATSVYHQGYLYGFHGMSMPATSAGVTLRCVALGSGEVAWQTEGLGTGSIILAGDQLVILTVSGELILAPASASGFQPTARAAILESTVRALPALADGHFYARDEKQLIAIDLSPPADKPGD